MNKENTNSSNILEVRLLDVPALCAYMGLGRNTAMNFAKAAGAEKKFGRRCLYDRKIIDKAIDEMGR